MLGEGARWRVFNWLNAGDFVDVIAFEKRPDKRMRQVHTWTDLQAEQRASKETGLLKRWA